MSWGLVLDPFNAFRRERFSLVKCFQKGGGAGKGAFGICCSWFAMVDEYAFVVSRVAGNALM